MSLKDYIPRPDKIFLPWVAKFLKHLLLMITKLGLHADDLEELDKLNDAFVAAFNIADDPETRTSSAILNKNNARKALESEVRAFVRQYISGNRDLTDADRNDLGLPVYSNVRAPSRIPETYPDVDIDSSVIRRLKIFFRDQGKDSKAKPPGVHGVEIRSEFLDHAPIEVEELTHSVFDTRSPYTFEYRESDRGRTVYFTLRWENTRGEKGPWSEIYSAIVP